MTRGLQRKYFLAALFWLLGLCMLRVAWAQSGPIAIENRVDRAKVTIGDLITYTLEVTHDEKLEVKLPGRAFVVLDTAGQILPDDALNISDYQQYPQQQVNGQVVERVEYVFSPFLVGQFTVASLTVTYKAPGDTSYQRIFAEPIQIVVESLKPSATGDIRDLKAQWEIQRNLWLIITPILIGLGVLGLIILLIIFYKRWRAGKALLPRFEKPPRPPHEIALEALDELVHTDLLATGQVKEFYIRISDIIRRYIEGRYFIVAVEMTTSQLLLNLQSANVEPEITTLIRDFLNQCDLVKFAKYLPEAAENDEIIRQAYAVVHQTKLILETPAETAVTPTTAPDYRTLAGEVTPPLVADETTQKELQ